MNLFDIDTIAIAGCVVGLISISFILFYMHMGARKTKATTRTTSDDNLANQALQNAVEQAVAATQAIYNQPQPQPTGEDAYYALFNDALPAGGSGQSGLTAPEPEPEPEPEVRKIGEPDKRIIEL